MTDKYKEGLQRDKETSAEYFRKSVVKTEQQKFLEKLLEDKPRAPEYKIADIACGGGTLSYHLAHIFPKAKFTLVDYLEEALQIARELNSSFEGWSFQQGNIYDLSNFQSETFDFVFCWQTLSWLDKPEAALRELVRIAKPGAHIYLSSLFNIDHDVDIYSHVFDHTRESGANNIPFNYNTYSEKTVRKWLNGVVRNVQFFKFIPELDFSYEGRGLGTFTKQAESGRLQISGGLLMNWAVLHIVK